MCSKGLSTMKGSKESFGSKDQKKIKRTVPRKYQNDYFDETKKQ